MEMPFQGQCLRSDGLKCKGLMWNILHRFARYPPGLQRVALFWKVVGTPGDGASLGGSSPLGEE